MIKHFSTEDIQELVECIIKEIKNAEIIIKDNNLTGPNSYIRKTCRNLSQFKKFPNSFLELTVQ